jgi:GNAT superfamily N-acetyltransferase
VFLVVRDDDGRAIGCGGVCRFDTTRAELKRMYVRPESRGLGLGRRLLVELEEHARALGYAGLVLETGDRQPESVGLYVSAGFDRIPCYPPYSERSLSLCFEKRL